MRNGGARLSTLAIVSGMVSLVAILAAVALFVSGDSALQRLGVVAAAVGLVLPQLAALLRADQSATQTNGINTILTSTNAKLADTNAALAGDPNGGSTP